MTWGKWYWPYYLIVASLAFIIPEVIALLTNLNNTLSRYARFELDITVPKEPLGAHSIAWFLSLIMWVIVAGLLTYHIWLEKGLRI